MALYIFITSAAAFPTGLKSWINKFVQEAFFSSVLQGIKADVWGKLSPICETQNLLGA